jgi:hypothetical protein
MVLSDIVVAHCQRFGGERYNSTFVHHLITIFSEESAASAGWIAHERFLKEVDDLMDNGGSAKKD